MELLMNPDILDFNVSLFSVFYLTATSLVGFLGAGQLYLVLKHKASHIFLAFVVIFSLVLLVGLILKVEDFPDISSLSLTGDLGEDIRVISGDYLSSVYIYVVILASVGGMVLLLGAAYSFFRDRSRYYALFFVIGALMPILRNRPFGYLGNELVAVILFFIGFILSVLYMNKQKD